MEDKRDQRINIKFCFLLKKSAAETLVMLREAYKEKAMGQTQVYEWYSRFKRGDMSVEDQPKSGRPSTSHTDANIMKVSTAIREDRRRSIRDIAEIVGISWTSCERILTQDLKMRRIAAKFVPRLLTEDQRNNRVAICENMKEQLQGDDQFLNKIITSDETWCFAYDPESKQQSSQWKTTSSPRPKKARQVKSNIKSMLICFFDVKGIVHFEFVPAGQTVNQHFYIEVLKRLRVSIRKKRPQLWATKDFFIHHDNAPAHTALSVQQFLTKNDMTAVPHPPYSPDLAPCDFYLFPNMKRHLKGKRFQNVEEVKQRTIAVLNGIKKEDFQKCFEKWVERWDKCIAANGEYFEGD